MPDQKRKGRTIAFFFVAFASVCCNESIPGYEAPDHVLESAVSATYIVSPSSNYLKIVVTVKNVFDETLSDSASIHGMLEILLSRRPEIRKTVTLSDTGMPSTPAYDRRTKVLTLDPGQSFDLVYSWNFVDDMALSLSDSVFRKFADTTCGGIERFIALPEQFTLQGNVVVYQKTSGTSFGPAYFKMCYVEGFFPLRECPPLPPCN